MNKLLKIRKYLGLTQRQLADVLGVGQNNISQIENGVISLTDRNKFRLVERLHINLCWLETGDGEIVCDEESALAQLPKTQLSERAETIIKRGTSQSFGAPFINIAIANGVVPANFDATHTQPDSLIEIPLFGEVSFYRPIAGNSMSPRLKSNDYVACQGYPHHNTIQFGEVYLCVATINGQWVEYIRIIRKHEDDTKIILRPTSDEYDDIIIAKENIIKLYIIKGSISKFA